MDVAKLHAALDERVDGEVRFDPRHPLSAYAQGCLELPAGADRRGGPAHRGRGRRSRRRVPGDSGRRCCPVAAGPAWQASASTPRSSSTGPRTATVLVSFDLRRPGPPRADRHGRWTRSTTRWRLHGLMVGPKPSTHVSCTHRRHDREQLVRVHGAGVPARWPTRCAALRCSPTAGLRTWVGETSDEEYEGDPRGRRCQPGRRCTGGCARSGMPTLGEIRTATPKIPRRVSGYNLDQLLPGERVPRGQGLWSAARARWSPCCTRR